MRDPMHNLGLALTLEACRISHIASLYAEADEPSL